MGQNRGEAAHPERHSGDALASQSQVALLDAPHLARARDDDG
ncbi:hypothetical protein ACW4TU_04030 [Streptomyces sp. QTS52]